MLKKILLFCVLFSSLVFSDPLSSTFNGTYHWEGVGSNTEIDTNGAFDTLAGATDSSDIISNFNFEEGWRYILTRDAITGTGSDSIAVAVRVYAYDDNANLMYYVAVDSMTAAAGEQIEIPYTSDFGGGIFNYKIRLFTYTGNGGQVIINRLYLMKRKPYVVSPASVDYP